jgi:hypothetical protein
MVESLMSKKCPRILETIRSQAPTGISLRHLTEPFEGRPIPLTLNAMFQTTLMRGWDQQFFLSKTEIKNKIIHHYLHRITTQRNWMKRRIYYLLLQGVKAYRQLSTSPEDKGIRRIIGVHRLMWERLTETANILLKNRRREGWLWPKDLKS